MFWCAAELPAAATGAWLWSWRSAATTGSPARPRETDMSSALATRISQEHASAAGTLPASVIDLERRRRALQALEAHGLPTSRDENWKYANLRPLEKVRFAPATQTADATRT